jgi:hypothetical protein
MGPTVDGEVVEKRGATKVAAPDFKVRQPIAGELSAPEQVGHHIDAGIASMVQAW